MRDVDTDHCGDLGETGVVHGAVVYDDGIVEVAALDKSGGQQGFDLADEDECACGGNLAGELIDMLHRGILVGENG